MSDVWKRHAIYFNQQYSTHTSKIQRGKHILEFVLGNLAGSSLEGGKFRQAPSFWKSYRGWVKIDGFFPGGAVDFGARGEGHSGGGRGGCWHGNKKYARGTLRDEIL